MDFAFTNLQLAPRETILWNNYEFVAEMNSDLNLYVDKKDVISPSLITEFFRLLLNRS